MSDYVFQLLHVVDAAFASQGSFILCQKAFPERYNILTTLSHFNESYYVTKHEFS